ncbi:MAG: hydroxymethylpyrimidine/phosphomethylpyrimidine kinase [Planctomycetota bacterium]
MIAGWDPTGGAGIAADLAVLTGHGVTGSGAVSAVTSQGPRGLGDLRPVDAALVRAQIGDALDVAPPHVVKIGLLPDAPTIEAVHDALRDVDVPIVLDPVLGVSAGGWHLDASGLEALRTLLVPRVAVITPNGPEARALVVGVTNDDHGAGRLLSRAARGVVVTGGHAPGREVCDVVFVGGEEIARFSAPRVEGGPFHGTGCAFASSLAARLARGDTLLGATAGAREYVRGLLRLAAARGAWRLPFALLRAGGENVDASAGTVGATAIEEPA